jgi:hypothetical protein
LVHTSRQSSDRGEELTSKRLAVNWRVGEGVILSSVSSKR